MSILNKIRETYGVACDTDSYKLSHHPQYLQGADKMMSYIESRGGMFDSVVWFGMQLIIKEYMLERVTHEQVDNLIAFEKAHFGGNCTPDLEIAFRAVVDDYDGKLPIKIRSAAEGSIIPVKNVLATIETTVADPRIFSLVSYFETKLLRVWAPTTVATMSYNIRKVILDGLTRSSESPLEQIPFKLHDFGARGVSAMETAAFAGAGHLVSFMGSDTLVAIMAANIGYNTEMAGFSIPASEHSTTTMWGPAGEYDFVDNMFNHYAKPGAIFATVADSFDILDFIDNIAPQFKERLEESGATWVLRPDSSDPVQMPVECVRRLAKHFGYTTNAKGYKVLNNVRVIQGDGIDIDDVKNIVNTMLDEKWSIDNIAFGMGGGLLQKNDRDTQMCAMICCAARVDGEWIDVYKSPVIYNADNWEPLDPKVDDAGFKTSKKGRLELVRDIRSNEYITLNEKDARMYKGRFGWEFALETVYENGKMVKEFTFDEVRKNAGTL